MKRIPELDALRGLAAIGVVAFHAFPSVFFWGWSCVDLFFVLSGYLITTIIIRQQSQQGFLRSFYLRRIARIWPAYFLTLTVVVVVNSLSRTGYPTDGLVYHLVFLQRSPAYLGLPTPPFIGTFSPSWSVAIEEQFYLVWPMLLMVAGIRRIPLIAAVFITLCELGRLCIPGEIFILLTRGDGLAFGCFLAWLCRGEGAPSTLRRYLPWLTITALVSGGYVVAYLAVFWRNPHPGWQNTCFTGFSMFYFALIGFCVCLTGSRVLLPLRNSVLRWFGTISYSLYLFHYPIFHYTPSLVERLGIRSPTISIALTWTALVVLPALCWYLVERPILGLSPSRVRTDESDRATGKDSEFEVGRISAAGSLALDGRTTPKGLPE
jgi:peptidoglycan/LPS O-acetylase OafA/YrhL